MAIRASRAGLGALLALLLCGCPSTTTYRTADPVAPGKWQVAAATGLGGMRDDEQDTRIPTGHLELGVRRGIVSDLDVGFELHTIGAEINATWRFARGEWSWALAPALAGVHTRESAVLTDAIHLFANGVVIASRRLSPRWHLALGPLAGWGLYWPETGGSAHGAWLGGFVNADLAIGKRWHLRPELGMYRVFAGEVPVRGSAINLGVGLALNL